MFTLYENLMYRTFYISKQFLSSEVIKYELGQK